MKTYQDCAEQYGVYTCAGEKYILLEYAFLTTWYGGGYDGYTHYQAKCVPVSAVESYMGGDADGYDENNCSVARCMVWDILPDHDMDDDDEGDACDWENPEGVFTRF